MKRFALLVALVAMFVTSSAVAQCKDGKCPVLPRTKARVEAAVEKIEAQRPVVKRVRARVASLLARLRIRR